MAEKKKKFIKTTPEGIAMFPWLTKADTKFNPDGDYKVDLKMDRAVADELIEQLDEYLDTEFNKVIEAAKPADRKKITKADTYHLVYDDEGEETGEVFLRFKLKAKVTPKDGKPFAQKPNGFDADGSPWDDETPVYGGSVIKVNFEAVPYGPDSNKKVGLTLRLRAFQVKELVTTGGASASGYGFDSDGDATTTKSTPKAQPQDNYEEDEDDGSDDF